MPCEKSRRVSVGVGVGSLLLCLAWPGACLVAAPSAPKETPAAASGLFDDFDDTKEYPSAETLRALLAPVPGERYEIAEGESGTGRSGGWPASCD